MLNRSGKGAGGLQGLRDWDWDWDWVRNWNWAQEPAGGIISTLNSKGAVEACLKC